AELKGTSAPLAATPNARSNHILQQVRFLPTAFPQKIFVPSICLPRIFLPMMFLLIIFLPCPD
ncbi:MAG TPA: hypothetical protein PLW35_12510, partial [Verrucomicrobiota bacterium]|nr:hypothetical protein [Verrucomicrobiota bacterium]